jgi:hypothetical protein
MNSVLATAAVQPASFSIITDKIVGTLTSTAAFEAYGAVAAVGLAVGCFVALAPKLFHFSWKFIPDEDTRDYPLVPMSEDFFHDQSGQGRW